MSHTERGMEDPTSAQGGQRAETQYDRNKPIIGSLAAGAAGGVLLGSAVLGAPIFGAIVGAGFLASAAATRDDAVGDASRAAGASTMRAYDTVSDFSKNNKIPEKVDAVAQTVKAKGAELDDKYDISTRFAYFTAQVALKAAELDSRYDISVTSAKLAADAVAQVKKMTGSSDSESKRE